MIMPSSGQISFSQINLELGRGSTDQISIQSAEDGGYVAIKPVSPYPSSGDPASLSEWWGYNHFCPYTYTVSIVSGLGDDQAFCGAGTFNSVYSTCDPGVGSLSVGCYVLGNNGSGNPGNGNQCNAGSYGNQYIQELNSGLNCLTDGSGYITQCWFCT